MNNPFPRTKIKLLTGWRAASIRLKFLLSVGKYIFQKKKYPLFILNPSKGGYLKTRKILTAINLRKIVKFNNNYYFSLSVPRWPSIPFDRMVANGGLNIMVAGTPLKSQIDIAILAITRKCSYDCKHCYEHFNLADADSVPIERWKEVIEDIQKMGASIITLSGGEPLLRYNGLKELLGTADKNLSEFHIYTSGHQVNKEKALALKEAGLKAAAIGLDDVNPERHDNLRGYKGSYKEAIRAIKYFYEADVFTYLNLCLTKDLIRSGDLGKYYELAKDLNVGAIRLLEPRPCGGYFSHNADNLFSEIDRKVTTEFFIESNQLKKYKDYPFVTYQAYLEDPKRLGCLMGGLTHFHIDSIGHVEPCVFLPISFGNIMEEDFSDIFKKMRKAIPHPLHKQCPGVSLDETIKIKKNKGIPLPIPYREMEKEWQQMFA
jgi:MoaA/NifB/PqqE/SkfB family radical SAM enzyme